MYKNNNLPRVGTRSSIDLKASKYQNIPKLTFLNGCIYAEKDTPPAKLSRQSARLEQILDGFIPPKVKNKVSCKKPSSLLRPVPLGEIFKKLDMECGQRGKQKIANTKKNNLAIIQTSTSRRLVTSDNASDKKKKSFSKGINKENKPSTANYSKTNFRGQAAQRLNNLNERNMGSKKLKTTKSSIINTRLPSSTKVQPLLSKYNQNNVKKPMNYNSPLLKNNTRRTSRGTTRDFGRPPSDLMVKDMFAVIMKQLNSLEEKVNDLYVKSDDNKCEIITKVLDVVSKHSIYIIPQAGERRNSPARKTGSLKQDLKRSMFGEGVLEWPSDLKVEKRDLTPEEKKSKHQSESIVKKTINNENVKIDAGDAVQTNKSRNKIKENHSDKEQKSNKRGNDIKINSDMIDAVTSALSPGVSLMEQISFELTDSPENEENIDEAIGQSEKNIPYTESVDNTGSYVTSLEMPLINEYSNDENVNKAGYVRYVDNKKVDFKCTPQTDRYNELEISTSKLNSPDTVSPLDSDFNLIQTPLPKLPNLKLLINENSVDEQDKKVTRDHVNYGVRRESDSRPRTPKLFGKCGPVINNDPVNRRKGSFRRAQEQVIIMNNEGTKLCVTDTYASVTSNV